MQDAYKERVISFNAVNAEDSYDFARALLEQYVEHATDLFQSHGELEYMGSENIG